VLVSTRVGYVLSTGIQKDVLTSDFPIDSITSHLVSTC